MLDALGRVKTRTTGASVDTYSYAGATNNVSRIANAGGSGTTTDSVVDPSGVRFGTKTGSTVAWLLADLHGSVAVGLNQAGTTVSDALRYDGAGMTVATYPGGGSAATKSWKYQGRLDVAASGPSLYDWDAREMSPGLGAFTSNDTVLGSATNPRQLNRYVYVGGNPTSFVDPDGHAIYSYDCENDPAACADAGGAVNLDGTPASSVSSIPGGGGAGQGTGGTPTGVVDVKYPIAPGPCVFDSSCHAAASNPAGQPSCSWGTCTGVSGLVCQSAGDCQTSDLFDPEFSDGFKEALPGGLAVGFAVGGLCALTAGVVCLVVAGGLALYGAGSICADHGCGAEGTAFHVGGDNPWTLRTAGNLAGSVAGGAAGSVAGAGVVGSLRGGSGVVRACSFTGDTPVATASGAVAISAIAVGDTVLAWEESSNRVVERPVTAVMPHPDDEIARLVLSDGIVTTTPDHPFYTLEAGWVEAGLLRPGMHVKTATGTASVSLVKTKSYSGTLWDLTIEGAHTFFVGSGAWLVHNCPETDIPGRPFTGKNAPEAAYQHLDEYHAIPPEVASQRLHQIKSDNFLGPTDDVVIGRTGDVYDARTGDWLGSLTKP